MDFASDAAFLKQPWPMFHLMTDASLSGYGAAWEGRSLSGLWGAADSVKHINQLELKAVVLGIRQWAQFWTNGEVVVLTDSSTVVGCIRKQGSNKYLRFQELVHEIWALASTYHFRVSTEFLPGRLNVKADLLSRRTAIPSEWSLDRRSFLWISDHLGPFDIDLCATLENRQVNQFVSPYPCSKAVGHNVLALDWARWGRKFIFPPVALLPTLLPLLRRFANSTVVVAPWWPAQDWTLALLNIFAFHAPLPPYHLSQEVLGHRVFHPNPDFWHYHVWASSNGLIGS
jgi:ribonuclease HI